MEPGVGFAMMISVGQCHWWPLIRIHNEFFSCFWCAVTYFSPFWSRLCFDIFLSGLNTNRHAQHQLLVRRSPNLSTSPPASSPQQPETINQWASDTTRHQEIIMQSWALSVPVSTSSMGLSFGMLHARTMFRPVFNTETWADDNLAVKLPWMLTLGKLLIETVPRRRAMPDPVLSDVPPSTEVTLTLLSCKGHQKLQNISFHRQKKKTNEITEHNLQGMKQLRLPA